MVDNAKIFWSDQALRNLEAIILYLKTSWSEKEVDNFLKKLDHGITLIAQRPKMFPVSLLRSNLRRFVLTKQVSIIYTETKLGITIVSLFDNRQDPSTL
jgi:plasmid stabilization system protein ParE